MSKIARVSLGLLPLGILLISKTILTALAKSTSAGYDGLHQWMKHDETRILAVKLHSRIEGTQDPADETLPERYWLRVDSRLPLELQAAAALEFMRDKIKIRDGLILTVVDEHDVSLHIPGKINRSLLSPLTIVDEHDVSLPVARKIKRSLLSHVRYA